MSHEPQGLHVRSIAIAGVIVGLSVVVVLGIGYLIWHEWAATAPNPARLPPQPRLQVAPAADLGAYRRRSIPTAEWQWVDETHRTARVPVDRAMRIMAKESTP